jgi:hypothetical protein
VVLVDDVTVEGRCAACGLQLPGVEVAVGKVEAL